MKKVYYFTMEELLKLLYRATIKEVSAHPDHETFVSKIGGGITFNVIDGLGATEEEITPVLDKVKNEVLGELYGGD